MKSLHRTALVVLAILIDTVCGKNQADILVPRIKSLPPPYEERVPISFNCELSTNFTLTSGQSALTWSRIGGMPHGYNTSSQQIINNEVNPITRYLSRLTFTPTSVDNEKTLTCTATVGVYTGLDTYQPEIILRPDQPLITGPDTVRANETATWSCISTGASRISPNVYLRDGSDQHLVKGIKQSNSIRIDADKNLIYTITKNWTTTLSTDNYDFLLKCYVVHEANNARYTSELYNFKRISVVYPPLVTGGNQTCNEGGSITLPCKVHSNPAPSSINWYRMLNNGNPRLINMSLGDRLSWGLGFSTKYDLTIVEVTSSDLDGDYSYYCEAVNDVGSDTGPVLSLVKYCVTMCPKGFRLEGALCYQAFDSKPFAEAVSTCQEIGAKLAEPRNKVENNRLSNFVLEVPVISVIWIGITDEENEGQFKYKSNCQNVTWTNWNENSPGNHGNSDCVIVHIKEFHTKWNVRKCENPRVNGSHYVCQTEPQEQSTPNVDEENTDRINYKSTTIIDNQSADGNNDHSNVRGNDQNTTSNSYQNKTEIESENPQLDKKQSTDYVYVLSIGLSSLVVLSFFAWLYYCFVLKTTQNKEKEQNPVETTFETFTKETSETSITSSSYYTSEILETSSTSYSSDLNIQTNGAPLAPDK